MKKVREISRGGGGDGVETKACSLIGNSGSDRQPVKMSEYWNDVNMWKSTDYKTGCTVLDSLKFADQGLIKQISLLILVCFHKNMTYYNLFYYKPSRQELHI